MTASTGRRDRARTRLQRLSRFEEILRFAALDSDLRALPKGLGISDRRQLAGLLQGDPRVDDSERERLLGDAAVVLHVVRAAHVWDELRRGSVISAFKDLQCVLERAGNTLAQFAPTAPPQPGRRPGRRTVQRANFARYFMATVFEEHETQRKVRDHRKRLSQESRLRPLQESPLFDVTRHAVAANMARRWYSVAGAVTRKDTAPVFLPAPPLRGEREPGEDRDRVALPGKMLREGSHFRRESGRFRRGGDRNDKEAGHAKHQLRWAGMRSCDCPGITVFLRR